MGTELRPPTMFDLVYFWCGLQLAATTITYLVILIQFQISEQDNKVADM